MSSALYGERTFSVTYKNMASQKQLIYLCHSLRSFKDQLPQRIDERGANCVWLDFEKWISTVAASEVSYVVKLFKDGREDDAVALLVNLGMPTKRDAKE